MVLLFSIDLGEIHFEEMSCSLHLNPNIFANDFENLPSFVLLPLYHQFSVSVPGKLSFLQYVKAKDILDFRFSNFYRGPGSENVTFFGWEETSSF